MVRKVQEIRKLFNLSEIRAYVKQLKHSGGTLDVFAINEDHREKYENAKTILDNLLIGITPYQINQVLKPFYPHLKCEVDKTLNFFLRCCHIYYINQDTWDFDLDTAVQERYSSIFIQYLPTMVRGEELTIAIGIFNIVSSLKTKTSFSMSTYKPKSKPDNHIRKIPSSQATISTSNALINYMGYLYPETIEETPFPEISFTFNYNEFLVAGENTTSSFKQTIKGKNEAYIQNRMTIIIHSFMQIFDGKFDSFHITPQPSNDIEIDEFSFKVSPDLEISVEKDGITLEIPMECKNGDISWYMENYSAETPLLPKSFNFTKLYSQLVREAVSTSISCGFIFNNESMYYVIFKSVDSATKLYAKSLATKTKCEFYKVENCSDLLKAIVLSFDQKNEKFKDDVLRETFAEEGIDSKLSSYYYSQISMVYENIERKLASDIAIESNKDKVSSKAVSEVNEPDTSTISEMKESDVNSSKIWGDSRLLDGISLVDMKQSHFLLLKTLSKRRNWKFQTFDEIQKLHKIEVLQGTLNKFNSSVLKLTEISNEQVEGKVYILKIIDPVYSKTHKNREDFRTTFTDSLVQFLKEIYSYNFLEGEDFIPSIINFGIIKNNNFKCQDEVQSEGISLSGFYIQMSFIEGKTLKEFSKDKRKQYESELVRILKVMHSKGVYHRDLTSTNIIIDNSGKCFIIDFGLSKIFLKRFGHKHTNSKVTKSRFDFNALNTALGIPLSTIFEAKNIESESEDDIVLEALEENEAANTPASSQLAAIAQSDIVLPSSAEIEGEKARKKPKLR